MKTKYQIFVSSTYEDLKQERDLVIKAILEMGHIPVGMEMFSAGDEEQWKLIAKQIEDCDYYIVIVAFRYGSEDGNISYTEKEYDYAINIGVPTLGFLINDDAGWNASHVDKKKDKVEKLVQFKEKIKRKMVKYWADKNDLYGKISIALMKQFNTNPRIGWIRADQSSGPEILKEISRLSKENSDLRQQIERHNNKKNQAIKDKFRQTLAILKNNKRNISFYYTYSTGWEDSTEFSLFEIFNLIAPNLMIELSQEYCSKYIGVMLKPNKDATLREKWGTPRNKTNQVLADLNVLELITPSSRKHKLNDENQYWTITDFGKEIYKEVRKEVLEKNLPLPTSNETPESENDDINLK